MGIAMRIFERSAKDCGFIERGCLARIGFAVASLVLLLLITRPVQSADDAGFVLNVQGTWLINGSDTKLENFRRVPPGSVIVFGGEYVPSYDEIEIALTNGTLVERQCRSADECDQPIKIIAGHEQDDPVMIRLLGPSLDDFHDYVTAISRGLTEPKEVVLKLDKGTLDVRPLLEGEPAGSYVLEFKRRSAAHRPVAPFFELPIVWDPKAPAAAKSAQTSEAIPGVFAVKYGPDYEEEEARALIVPGRNYEFAQEQFQQARKLAESCVGTSPESLRLLHRFLRLDLWSLASSTAEKQKAR